MLRVLLKKQMTEIFRNYFFDPKKNKARSKAVTAAYIVMFFGIMAGLLGGIFAVLSVKMCGPLADAGMDWLYFLLMGLIAVLLGVFGSVFNTYSSLYLAKDNDLMLSLPIPVKDIISSRLLSVYIMGAMYSLVVILPAVIVYWAVVSASAKAVIGCVVFILLISLFVLTLSCILGWVVARISLKLKHKSLVTVVVSLAFIGGYFFVNFKAQTLIQGLVMNAAVYGGKIKGAAYPLYLFGKAATGDPSAMAAVSAVILVLFAVMWLVISRSFLKIASSQGHAAGKVYKETAMKQRGAGSALLAKEFRRFVSSPNYMLNCGLGIVMLPVCGILLLWKGASFISVINEILGEWTGFIPLMLCAAVCMLASMNDMAAPSVSLEGKSLWLLQSLPVTPWQVLKAKLAMQMILTAVPALLCIVCTAIIYPYTAPELVLVLLVSMAFVMLSAMLGLFLGLKMPNLTWTSEITPIKQSACVMITMFSGFAYTLLMAGGFILIHLSFTLYMGIFAAVTLILCAVLYCWLKKRGCSMFAEL